MTIKRTYRQHVRITGSNENDERKEAFAYLERGDFQSHGSGPLKGSGGKRFYMNASRPLKKKP